MPDLFAMQAFAQDHGVIVMDPIPDGRIHPVPTESKPRKKNGRYLFDGERFGVMSWDAGHDRIIWMPRAGDDKRQADPAQAAEWLRKRTAASAAAKAEREQRRQRAAQRAADLLENAEVRTHPYLARKGFPQETGLVVDGVRISDGKELREYDDVLIIPMRTLAGDLVGCQRIYYDGERFEKKYLAGTPPIGAVFRIGPPNAREQWLCEGLVTALSIKAALAQMRVSAAVVVTFSAANLKHVADKMSGKVLVAADNDPPNEEHPERGETGQKAAKATRLPWCMPERLGEDFNDLHKRAGLFAVVSVLARTRSRAPG